MAVISETPDIKEMPVNQDEEHLRLLSIFHYIVGGLAALAFCFPLIHLAVGIAMVCGAFDGTNGPPRMLGWVFIVVPAMIILFGWVLAACIITAGRKLARREGRTFCLIIAGIECVFMPFGTVLGVFTIVVLTRDSVRDLFSAG